MFVEEKKEQPEILPNQPPTVALAASTTTIILPCNPGFHSQSGSCTPTVGTSVSLTTTASDPDGDTLLNTYTVTGGRVTGEGANVGWDLSGTGPGTYIASVDVDDGCGCITAAVTTVTIANCPDCASDVVCPIISSSCPDAVDPGQPLTFTANVGSSTPPVTGYNWTLSAGTIESGQGTTSITVSTGGLGGQSVTATLEAEGVDPSCGRTTSCTTAVRPPPPTPSPGVSPSPSPQATASAVASPSSSPSPDTSPGPTVSPSASSSGTPATEAQRHDQITVSYPTRFLTEYTSFITFDLSQVSAVRPTATVVNGNHVDRREASPPPGATPERPFVQSYGEKYDLYATVELKSNELTITKKPDLKSRLLPLAYENIDWTWQVTPADRNLDSASFYFSVTLVWILKRDTIVTDPQTDIPVRAFEFDWRDESDQQFSAPVGPSAFVVNATKYGSAVPALAGLGVLSTGRRRRKRILDKIITTVFSPREVQPGNSFMIQVFAHLGRHERTVQESAQTASPGAGMVDQQPLDAGVTRGTKLKFTLRIPELGVEETSEERTWQGQPIRYPFSVSIPRDFSPRVIVPRITVWAGEVPLGYLGFDLIVVGSAQTVTAESVNRGTAVRYKQAFISYAREDQLQVETAIQLLDADGQTYFYDAQIKPGELWGPLLDQKIDESDAFFLFWSEAASRSEWVGKEIDRALNRQGGDPNAVPSIFPFDLPPPVDPPAKLSHLNFNNRIRMMWAVGEQLRDTESDAN